MYTGFHIDQFVLHVNASGAKQENQQHSPMLPIRVHPLSFIGIRWIIALPAAAWNRGREWFGQLPASLEAARNTVPAHACKRRRETVALGGAGRVDDAAVSFRSMTIQDDLCRIDGLVLSFVGSDLERLRN